MEQTSFGLTVHVEFISSSTGGILVKDISSSSSSGQTDSFLFMKILSSRTSTTGTGSFFSACLIVSGRADFVRVSGRNIAQIAAINELILKIIYGNGNQTDWDNKDICGAQTPPSRAILTVRPTPVERTTVG